MILDLVSSVTLDKIVDASTGLSTDLLGILLDDLPVWTGELESDGSLPGPPVGVILEGLLEIDPGRGISDSVPGGELPVLDPVSRMPTELLNVESVGLVAEAIAVVERLKSDDPEGGESVREFEASGLDSAVGVLDNVVELKLEALLAGVSIGPIDETVEMPIVAPDAALLEMLEMLGEGLPLWVGNISVDPIVDPDEPELEFNDLLAELPVNVS